MVYALPRNGRYFPHPLNADPDGLLAVTDRLRIDQLILAYHCGIFPWYGLEHDAVLWWYTHPRFVLYLDEFKVSKSMRSLWNKNIYTLKLDHDFDAVIHNCAHISRPGQSDTWIVDDMIDAYTALFRLGYAHSVAVYNQEGHLVGGLYGVAIGQMFFGESMFSKESNSSKMALMYLVRFLKQYDFILIDCQQETKHLATLGARLITGVSFLDYIRSNALVPPRLGTWIDDSNLA